MNGILINFFNFQFDTTTNRTFQKLYL